LTSALAGIRRRLGRVVSIPFGAVWESIVAKVIFNYRSPLGLPGVVQPQPDTPPDSVPPGATVDRWWYESSYDLRSGLEVSDDASDTVPGDLLDELFKR
jgi:hypothetical protein